MAPDGRRPPAEERRPPGGDPRTSRRGRRARLDPEARRAQILDAACQLLETRGVDAMTIEDVADAAGVSRSLVYSHFGDRDGMVAEVYLRVLDQVDDAVLPGMPPDRLSSTERIAACLRYANDHPSAWRLLVTDSVRRHPVVMEAREKRVAGLTTSFDGAAAPLVADAALGLIEASVLHWIQDPRLPINRAAAITAELLWAGLAGLRGTSTKDHLTQPDGR